MLSSIPLRSLAAHGRPDLRRQRLGFTRRARARLSTAVQVRGGKHRSGAAPPPSVFDPHAGNGKRSPERLIARIRHLVLFLFPYSRGLCWAALTLGQNPGLSLLKGSANKAAGRIWKNAFQDTTRHASRE